jgi:hypothetical protein
MRMRRSTLTAAVLIAVATSIGGAAAASAAVHPATFAATDEGFGATPAAAQQNARNTLNGDYGPCKNIVLIDDGQLSNGTWWAEVGGNCTAFH